MRWFILFGLVLSILAADQQVVMKGEEPVNEFASLVDNLEERLNTEASEGQTKYNEDMALCDATKAELQARITQLNIEIPKARDRITATNADITRLNKEIAISEDTIRVSIQQVEEQITKIAKFKAVRAAAHADFLVKCGDVDEVIAAMKEMQNTKLQATTKLSLIQLPATLAAKVTELLATQWDATDQESFDRLKTLIGSLLAELFDYRGDLEEAEAIEIKNFEATLSTYNGELRTMNGKLLSERSRKAYLEADLAGVEMNLAQLEMKLDDLEEELELKAAALEDKQEECIELTKVFETEKKRRDSERETLNHLRGIMTKMGPLEPHVAERLKSITVGGKAQIVCAETMHQDAAKIQCPGGMVIHRVQFASYGKPEGECPNYKLNPTCHALDLTSIQNECLGKTGCTATPPPPPTGCTPQEGDVFGWKIAVVCQTDSGVPYPKKPVIVAPAIPSGVNYKKVGQWFIFMSPSSFLPTTDPCTQYKMTLSSIHSDAVNQALTAAIAQSYPDVEECWIGLQYKYNAGWQWRDGTPLDFTRWHPGEPNGYQNEPNVAKWVRSPHGSAPNWNDEGRPMPCFICSPAPAK